MKLRHRIHRFLNESLGFKGLFAVLLPINLAVVAIPVYCCAVLLGYLGYYDLPVDYKLSIIQHAVWIALSVIWTFIAAYGITFNYKPRRLLMNEDLKNHRQSFIADIATLGHFIQTVTSPSQEAQEEYWRLGMMCWGCTERILNNFREDPSSMLPVTALPTAGFQSIISLCKEIKAESTSILALCGNSQDSHPHVSEIRQALENFFRAENEKNK